MENLMVCSGMCSHSALEEIASFLLCFIFPLLLLSYKFPSARRTEYKMLQNDMDALNLERTVEVTRAVFFMPLGFFNSQLPIVTHPLWCINLSEITLQKLKIKSVLDKIVITIFLLLKFMYISSSSIKPSMGRKCLDETDEGADEASPVHVAHLQTSFLALNYTDFEWTSELRVGSVVCCDCYYIMLYDRFLKKHKHLGGAGSKRVSASGREEVTWPMSIIVYSCLNTSGCHGNSPLFYLHCFLWVVTLTTGMSIQFL